MGAQTAGGGTFLLVDDEPNVTAALRRILRPLGHRAIVATNGAEALELLETNEVDVLVTDMRMPVMDGAELLREVSSRWPKVVRILLTGYADLALTTQTIQCGWTDHFLTKPWEPEQVARTLSSALDSRWAGS